MRHVMSLAQVIGILTAGIWQSALATDIEPSSSSEPSCVEVVVNGERAPSYACLTQKLQPKPTAKNPNTGAVMSSEAIANRPSNQLGLFNHAATSNRMGNTFGTSVLPQRPPPPNYGSPMLPR